MSFICQRCLDFGRAKRSGLEPYIVMNIVIKTANAMNCIEGTQKVIAAGSSRYCLRQHELMR